MHRSILLVALLWSGLNLSRTLAEPLRAVPAGATPKDHRLEPLKDLDGYFPFQPARSKQDWDRRAEQVRRQILVSQGLWPMPKKTPLNAVIHGKLDRGDYTVEKVYFESFPGFFVTGNLYRPKNASRRVPGVLNPHGHWENGRFYDLGLEAVRKQIKEGGEMFEEGGRSPLQARCVQLARMGCVAFHYDMIGYADSQQISFDVAHRFAKQRPEMNSAESWGLFSPQAEANLQSVMGLQTWNSIRALDFLTSLPDVDPDRIAVTGASGGGTQTFILGAIDERVALAFPAVMVSTAMQGGCTCENACLLRVGTGNVEFAALFAPKPLGLTSANDWTREMAAKGFPELRQHFAMLGAPDNLMLQRGEQFDHNYNHPSRAAMYNWVNRHFKMGLPEPVAEKDYKRLSREEMTVWDSQHPQPPGGAEFEKKLLRIWKEDSDQQLQQAFASPEEFRRIGGSALEAIIGRTLSEAGDVEFTVTSKLDRGTFLEIAGLLRNETHQEELPAVFFYPKEWNKKTVVWVHSAGKAGLYEKDGDTLRPEARRILESGASLVGVDLLFQGEFVANGQTVDRTRRVKNPREAAAYTFGYNPSLFAQRVHDILTVVQFVKNHERKSDSIALVGLQGAGPWVATARALTRNAVDMAAVDTQGFRFGQVTDIYDVNFLPGGAKYSDLEGILALNAPGKLWLAGEKRPRTAALAYNLGKAADNLQMDASAANQVEQKAINWLLKN